MHEDIPGAPKELVIVSDTRIYNDNGTLTIFEATLREIEELTEVFDRIRWIGFLQDEPRSGSARAPNTDKIELIPLPKAGGHTLGAKLAVLRNFPHYIREINRQLENVTYVHSRGPCVPSLIAILKSLVDRKRRYWHKYAGNWSKTSASANYTLQKKLLLRAGHTFVSINGRWSDQRPHIHSFENPCYSEQELQAAQAVKRQKRYDGPLNLCFVGRIEEEKGVGRVLEALGLMKNTFNQVYIVGGGKALDRYRRQATAVDQPIHFTGLVQREKLNEIYEASHIFTLPSSASEGFPKVISEAASYGCVPVVSSVSSIGQYIKTGENGVLLENLDPAYIAEQFDQLFENRDRLKRYAGALDSLLEIFTYQYYNRRLQKEFLGSGVGERVEG